MTIQVLYEDNHLLVLNKPAGVATQGAAQGQGSLIDQAREYIKRKYYKPGNVYLGIVSRLDSVVTGVIVLARTSKAATRLTRQFQTGQVRKTYWAVVEGRLRPETGQCNDWLIKDDGLQRMVVTPAETKGAKLATLHYRTLRAVPGGTLLEIDLRTGRKHQIRVQLAERGACVLGDRKYGARVTFSPGIALHARRLQLPHPVRGELLEFAAPLPASWLRFGPLD